MLEYSVTIFWQNIITIFTNVLKLYNKDIFFDRFMILASKRQPQISDRERSCFNNGD